MATTHYTAKQIDELWREFRAAIDRAQKAGVEGIRDYASNQTWHDATDALVARETVHETKHRKLAPAGHVHPLSKPMAAKRIILIQAADGCEQSEMPPATIFLQRRDTAAEAYLVGYLIREHLGGSWRAQAHGLDDCYAGVPKIP